MLPYPLPGLLFIMVLVLLAVWAFRGRPRVKQPNDASFHTEVRKVVVATFHCPTCKSRQERLFLGNRYVKCHDCNVVCDLGENSSVMTLSHVEEAESRGMHGLHVL